MGFTIDHINMDQVLSALQQRGTRCHLEEVAALCPKLTEDQVILAIGSLTRSRQVCLTLDVNRTYWVRV